MKPTNTVAAASALGQPLRTSTPLSGLRSAASSRAMSAGMTTTETLDSSQPATPIAATTTIPRQLHAAASLIDGETYGSYAPLPSSSSVGSENSNGPAAGAPSSGPPCGSPRKLLSPRHAFCRRCETPGLCSSAMLTD
jgi:hypothetical protein